MQKFGTGEYGKTGQNGYQRATYSGTGSEQQRGGSMVIAPLNNQNGIQTNQQFKATTRLNTENCLDDPPPKIS